MFVTKAVHRRDKMQSTTFCHPQAILPCISLVDHCIVAKDAVDDKKSSMRPSHLGPGYTDTFSFEKKAKISLRQFRRKL